VKPRRPGRAAPVPRSPKTLFIVFGVIAALALVYEWNSVILAPKSRQASQVRAELATAKSRENEVRRQLAQLQKLAGETQARQAELAHLGQLVPAGPDVAGAILALNDVANQAHVAWSSFVPTTSTPAPGAASAPGSSGSGLVTLGITMKVGGTFPQIFDYLSRLENLDRLVVVDSINLGGGPAAGGLNADIKARMFSIGTASATPTTASGVAPASALAKAGA
jgi:Tfp pilus assembly protein PilO